MAIAMRAVASSFLAAGALSLAAAAEAAGPLRPEYVELVQRYARSERRAAVAALGSWDGDNLEQVLRTVTQWARARERCPTCPDPFAELPLRAAALLHADRDEVDRPPSQDVEKPRACASPHTAIVVQYAHGLSAVPSTREFGRRLFLAMGQRAQWDFCLDQALTWAAEARRHFESDADLLLLQGAVNEESATLFDTPNLQDASMKRASRDAALHALSVRSEWLKDARDAYVRCLEADPTRAETRVRLGRVLWRLGEGEAARQALEGALSRTGDRALLYLAHLFLGRVHEDAGRLEPARAAYREAASLDPDAQAAAVALSHVLLLRGEPESSRQVLRTALGKAGRRPERDAYWNYLASNAAKANALYLELRHEASR